MSEIVFNMNDSTIFTEEEHKAIAKLFSEGKKEEAIELIKQINAKWEKVMYPSSIDRK